MCLHNLVIFWFSGWEFIAETNSAFVLPFTTASRKCFQMETLNSKLKTSPEKIGISCLLEIGNLRDLIKIHISWEDNKKFTKSSKLSQRYIVSFKKVWWFRQIFAAFSECTNFNLFTIKHPILNLRILIIFFMKMSWFLFKERQTGFFFHENKSYNIRFCCLFVSSNECFGKIKTKFRIRNLIWWTSSRIYFFKDHHKIC